jgi:hypothetical protein
MTRLVLVVGGGGVLPAPSGDLGSFFLRRPNKPPKKVASDVFPADMVVSPWLHAVSSILFSSITDEAQNERGTFHEKGPSGIV